MWDVRTKGLDTRGVGIEIPEHRSYLPEFILDCALESGPAIGATGVGPELLGPLRARKTRAGHRRTDVFLQGKRDCFLGSHSGERGAPRIPGVLQKGSPS